MSLVREARLVYVRTVSNSNKFYELKIRDLGALGHQLTRSWGRIGTLGQSESSGYPDAASASEQYDMLLAAKVRKGYVVETDRWVSGVTAIKAAQAKRAAENAKKDELPDGNIHGEGNESKSFNKLAAKRKEESEW